MPLGVYQAYRRDRFFDKSASFITFLFISVPGIVLAVFLKLIFIEGWELFPRLGDKIYPWEDPGEHFRNFFLPTMTLAIPIAAVLTRLLRADMVAHAAERLHQPGAGQGDVAATHPAGATPCATRCSR